MLFACNFKGDCKITKIWKEISPGLGNVNNRHLKMAAGTLKVMMKARKERMEGKESEGQGRREGGRKGGEGGRKNKSALIPLF